MKQIRNIIIEIGQDISNSNFHFRLSIRLYPKWDGFVWYSTSSKLQYQWKATNCSGISTQSRLCSFTTLTASCSYKFVSFPYSKRHKIFEFILWLKFFHNFYFPYWKDTWIDQFLHFSTLTITPVHITKINQSIPITKNWKS